MIAKVSLRNFRAHQALDMELEPFTVFVGPNASGKTTLLQGLYALSKTAGEMMSGGRSYWPVPSRVRSYGSKAPVEIIVHGQWKGVQGFIKVSNMEREVFNNDEPALPFRLSGSWMGKEFFVGDWQQEKGSNSGRSDFYGDLDWEAVQQLRKELTSTAILQFEAERLADVSYGEQLSPRIEPDGTGLASLLAHLKLSQDEVFDDIETALREIIPTLRRVRIDRALMERTVLTDEGHTDVKVWGDKLILDMQGAKGVLAEEAGEGTIMALGLLTVLLAPPFPRLVLLDDIELKLHPAAQAKLIEVLRAIQKRYPGLQIVATSHSPFILNYLNPKEVRMTFLAENGFARCEKLTAHPEFEQWKDLMRPGEFWSTVGERWIGELGNPTSHE